MRSRVLCIAFWMVFLLMLMPGMGLGATYHVDVSRGNDSNPGTISQPFQTIGKAKTVISGTTGNTVYIADGEYYLSQPLTFGSADSGASGAPNVYAAQAGANPAVKGSIKIPVSAFTVHSGQILKANLSSYNLGDISQVFMNGTRQILARYPNFNPQNPIGGGWLYAADDTPGTKTQLRYRSGDVDLSGWNVSRAQVNIFSGYNYWNNILGVSSIATATRLVTLASGASYNIEANNRYYFQRILAELDAPNEWYWDNSAKILYFWPEHSLTGADEISIPVSGYVLDLNAAHYIQFQGLTFSECSADAVRIRTSNSITLSNCTVGHANGIGVDIGDGYNVTVEGCEIYDTGSWGVYAHTNTAYFQQLTSCNHVITHNNIHDTNVYKKGSYGGSVYVDAVGVTVSWNQIHHVPRMAVRFDGNENIIEYNYVHHVNQETEDTGAIYQGARSWIQRGNVVRHNYIDGSGGYGWDGSQWKSPYNTYGIYLDDFSNGTQIYGNAIRGSYRGAIFVHGGRDNLIEDNAIVASTTSEQVLLYPASTQYLQTMWDELQAVKTSANGWNGTKYYQRYPELKTITTTSPPQTMSGNTFTGNLVVYPQNNTQAYRVRAVDYPSTEIDNNIIWAGTKAKAVYNGNNYTVMTWAAWNQLGFDVHSTDLEQIRDPAYPGQYLFLVNTETQAQNFSLGSQAYRDIAGQVISGSVTLSPFEYKLLLPTQTTNPTSYTLSVTATHGSVTKTPDQTSYTSGQTVTLQATPSAGYTFSGWSGGLTGTANPATLTMNANKSVTANFTAVTYTLAVSATNGTVTKTPDQTSYTSGQTVTLQATPSAGYTFSGWSGGLTGTANPATLTMNANKSVTANFTAVTYTLAVSATNGTVTKTPDQTSYTSGQTVTLQATPSAGYTFSGWSGGLTGTANPATLTMNGNKSVTATFTAVTYTLAVSATNGTVTKTPDQTSYTSGQTVTLQATPSAGYTFSGWSGGLTGTANPATLTMNGNKSVTATFTAVTYTLAVSATNGTVTKTPDQTSYTSGQTVTLQATPSAGYTFSGWSGGLTGTANPATLTMNGNKSVTATFTAVTYTLAVSATNGTVTKTPDQTSYTSGQTVTLQATPSAGYTFSGWSGGLTGTANPATLTMNANKSVTATFTAVTYTLAVSATNGTVTKTPDQTSYTSGQTVTLQATPSAGYTFSGWSGGLTGTANPATLTMNGNKSVTATFTAVTYTLAVSATNGTVTKTPDQTSYTSGQTVTLQATPSAGYTFSGWSGGLTGTANPATLTMNGNKSVTATFTAVTYTLAVSATNGTVTKTPDQTSYTSGQTVTLQATPSTGYTFSGWSGGLTGTANPATLTMNGNKSVTATFTAVTPGIYHVDVSRGNDSNPGTISQPFQTIGKAKTVISGTTGNTVYIADGEYYLSQPLTFGSADSGASGAPNVYAAQAGANPAVKGSIKIPVSAFTVHSGQILKANLSSYNLGDISQVFMNGTRQILARYPNFNPQNPIGGGWLYAADDTPGTKTQLRYRSGDVDLSGWNVSRAQVNIFSGYNYWNNILGVSSIATATRLVTLASGASYNIEANNRYYFQRILAELDAPNEWYWDNSAKILYFWPEHSLTGADEISIPVSGYVLDLNAAHYIQFQGLTFSECSADAVRIRTSNSITLSNCTVGHANGIGVDIGDGYNVTVEGCEIYDTGSWGVYAHTNTAYFQQLTSCNHVITHNNIHDTDVYKKGSYGGSVYVYAVGVTVSWNQIHHVPRLAVRFDGNENIIEYNYVHHVNQETEDTGAIYQGARSWIQRGNVVRHNYIDGSGGYGWDGSRWRSPYSSYGIWLSDFSSGARVYGNAIRGSYRGAIFVHGGRDNLLEDNAIVESRTNEQVLFGSAPTQYLQAMWDELQAVKTSANGWNGTKYYQRYPELKTITMASPPQTMSGNAFTGNLVVYPLSQTNVHYVRALDYSTSKIDNNILWSGTQAKTVNVSGEGVITWDAWQQRGFDKNSTDLEQVRDSAYPGQYLFLVNTENQQKSFDLGGQTYRDLAGQVISGSVTLSPFEYKLLLPTQTTNPTSYTLSVTATHGSVTKTPNQASYTSGQTVTLQATPSAGYTFSGWSGGLTGTANPATLTMNGNKSVTASFSAVASTTYTLSVSATHGSVTKTPDQTSYTDGQTVSLQATPSAGYTFSGWSVNLTGTTNPATLTVNGNKSVTANFTAVTYTLAVSATNGTVTKTPDQASYTSGQTVTLQATPSAGYTFSGWSGDLTGTTNPATLTMDANKSVVGSFTRQSTDRLPPVLGNCAPAPDAIQVPPNTLVVLHLSDAGEGVDAASVSIRVNGALVYTGDVDSQRTDAGVCRRVGTKADYTYAYQPHDLLGYNREISVTVNAQDLAGNTMPAQTYSFGTEMHAFGVNRAVTMDQTSLAQGQPVTVSDPQDHLWVVWHAGNVGSRHIYAARFRPELDTYTSTVQVSQSAGDHCHPALAIDSRGILYVAWQENAGGVWDICLSTSADGKVWSSPKPIVPAASGLTVNRTNPVVAAGRSASGLVAVAWQENSGGNQDICLATSTTRFLTATVAQVTSDPAAQTDPVLAIDSQDTVVVLWTDARNGATDLYGAASDHGPWTNAPVVAALGNQSHPTVAAGSTGRTWHLAWTDDAAGHLEVRYATSDGLPASPLAGADIIDDTSGADQQAPALRVATGLDRTDRIYVCWQDGRNLAVSGGTDVYFAEVGAARWGPTCSSTTMGPAWTSTT